jgi:hypothetical protein
MSDRDWEREERLTRVVRAAGFERSSVFLADFPTGHEGENWTTSRVTDAFVASWLSDPDAEATALHELAHEELGHNDDRGYLDALAKDQAAGVDHHRGPWEIEADNLAAAYVEHIRDQMTDADASLGCLETDAARYL